MWMWKTLKTKKNDLFFNKKAVISIKVNGVEQIVIVCISFKNIVAFDIHFHILRLDN